MTEESPHTAGQLREESPQGCGAGRIPRLLWSYGRGRICHEFAQVPTEITCLPKWDVACQVQTHRGPRAEPVASGLRLWVAGFSFIPREAFPGSGTGGRQRSQAPEGLVMTESAVPVALGELAQGAPSGWPLCFSRAVQVTANQQGRGARAGKRRRQAARPCAASAPRMSLPVATSPVPSKLLSSQL